MKKTALYIIAFLILGAAAGCSRRENLSPFGWEKVDARTDSLMLLLERHWLNHDDDSLIFPDLARLQSMADDAPDNVLLAVRNCYWQGRMALRQGQYDRADSLFARGLALNDSAAYPYETYRLRWTTEPDQLPYTVESYNYLHDQAEFFEKAGDLMLASSRWMDLGMMLNDLGLWSRAEEFLLRSDSLSSLGGFTEMLAGNRMNHAKVRYMAGDTLGATKILRQVLNDPDLQDDPMAINIVLDNLYMIGGDTAALFRAYDMALGNPEFEEQQAYYQGCMAEVYLRRNMADSALFHAHEAAKGFDLIESRRQQVDVMMWRAQAEQAVGNTARACQLYDSAQCLTERYIDETRMGEVFNHDFNQQLTEMERATERNIYRHRIINVVIVGLIIVISIAILFFFYRRLQQQRYKQMRQQLDLEKAQRRLMAMKLNLQSKDALIASIGENLSDNTADARQRVESAIRVHEATAGKQSETFEQIFGDLHPEFASRAKGQWPQLNDADIRLISLIALKLTNRQIASTLGIRHESVKQARWRLRTKMQLPADVTLDDAVARLM